jgi:CRISPR/Cas system-associated exonuclease Cas4 (RecB family)
MSRRRLCRFSASLKTLQQSPEAGIPARSGSASYKYADRKWPVPFGHRERRALLAILAEMRELEGAADVRRSHNHAGKCRGCDFNAPAICGQALA